MNNSLYSQKNSAGGDLPIWEQEKGYDKEVASGLQQTQVKHSVLRREFDDARAAMSSYRAQEFLTLLKASDLYFRKSSRTSMQKKQTTLRGRKIKGFHTIPNADSENSHLLNQSCRNRNVITTHLRDKTEANIITKELVTSLEILSVIVFVENP